MSKLVKNEDAFTGLEAAIVLIAFIVVAAVFSYVVLGAGFFTTQKSQEVVHTGVQQASSSMEIVGNVYGEGDTTNDCLTSIRFIVANTAGGTSLDVEQMVVTYVDESHHSVVPYSSGGNPNTTACWDVLKVYNEQGEANLLLESGEQFELQVNVTTPGPNTPFTVNLQPAAGAVYPIHKTVPPAIEAFNVLN